MEQTRLEVGPLDVGWVVNVRIGSSEYRDPVDTLNYVIDYLMGKADRPYGMAGHDECSVCDAAWILDELESELEVRL